MTLRELHAKLTELIEAGHGEAKVTVEALTFRYLRVKNGEVDLSRSPHVERTDLPRGN